MNLFTASGMRRFFLCLGTALCLAPCAAWAASITWASLSGVERLVIETVEGEGIPGAVARVDTKGILIPFTEVPVGLVVDIPPAAAKIFNGTRLMGRSLALMTQTAEFGYVVSKREKNKLTIDFFPDALGARWKPSQLPPTTDVPPTYAVPEHRVNATEPATSSPAVLSPSPPAPEASTQKTMQLPASPVNWGEVATFSQFMTGPPPDVRPAPVTVTSTGNVAQPPSNATTDLAPAQAQESKLAIPALSSARAEHPSALDIRVETESRNAPLPDPVHKPDHSGSLTALQQSRQVPKEGVAASPATEVSLASKNSTSEAPGVILREVTTDSVFQLPEQAQDVSPMADTSALPVAPFPAERNLDLSGIGVRVEPLVYRGKIHTGGPETLQSITEEDLAVYLAGQPLPAQKGPEPAPLEESNIHMAKNATTHEESSAPAGNNGTVALAVPTLPEVADNATSVEVIYQDEEGNVVEPPSDPAPVMQSIRDTVAQGNYLEALSMATALLESKNLTRQLTQDETEELLHCRAEMLFMLNQENFEKTYRTIADATQKAISFNQKSSRNALALLRLGYMNLKLNNTADAEVFFSTLRRQFPDNENVPLTYYYWGDYFYNENELHRAAREFQRIIEKYPKSKYTREAALGLARAHYRLGYYEQAFDVVAFIESRWPRFYLDYPPFLNMMGDVAFRLDNFDHALRYYWLYLNLSPQGEEVDIILTRIGDIYSLLKQKYAATTTYKLSAQRFPDKDGGLVAKMRLAETDINDIPTIESMFSVFDEPESYQPAEIYKYIIEKHPDSALVPLATLKLAMWYLWNQDYMKTLDVTSEMVEKFPKHELAPKAREVALNAFSTLTSESFVDGYFGRMRSVWEQYPILHSQEEILSPESRIGLAVSYWENGNPDAALNTVKPFFLGKKIARYSEMALNLVLTIYLQYQQWPAIEEVEKRVALWELTPKEQQRLDYALALAAENTGKGERASGLWKKLYEATQLPNEQMAYAAFFLARYAEAEARHEDAYLLGVDALGRLKKEAADIPEHADPGKIQSQLGALMTITENGGRLQEALAYTQEYLQMVPESDNETRASTEYVLFRIQKKLGNEDAWRKGMQTMAKKYPENIWGKKAAMDLKQSDIIDGASRFTGMQQP